MDSLDLSFSPGITVVGCFKSDDELETSVKIKNTKVYKNVLYNSARDTVVHL